MPVQFNVGTVLLFIHFWSLSDPGDGIVFLQHLPYENLWSMVDNTQGLCLEKVFRHFIYFHLVY